MPLERSSEVAVDLNVAGKAPVAPDELEQLQQNGRELRSGVVMLGSHEMSGQVARALDEAGALHPVFGGDDGRIVVLPEVRIETDDDEQAGRVRDYLKRVGDDVEVVRDAGSRLVVRPTSGRGADALDLANRVEEAAHPAMAQARFLRIVPRPG